MKKLRKILVVLLMMLVAEPIVVPVMSEPATQAQRDRQKEQKARQKARQKEQKARQKARKKEQKARQKARNQQRKDKVQEKKDEKNAMAEYQKEVDRVNAYNKKVLAYQNREINHYIGVWGQAGYSSLFQNFNNDELKATSKGGFGGGAGLGYQLQYKHFLLNTGLEMEVFNSRTQFTSTGVNSFMRDYTILPYNTMTFTYRFDKFRDKTQAGFLQIPVLAGGEWGRYYFLAGPKLGLGVIGSARTTASMTTSIVDDEMIGVLSDMLNHALVDDMPLESNKEKLNFGFNLGLAAEFGIYLDEWIHPLTNKKSTVGRDGYTPWWNNLRYRIGVFAEYGVLNVQSAKNAVAGRDLPVLFNDPTQPLDVSMAPLLSLETANKVNVNPFLVGVKVAVFYELPRKQRKLLPLPQEPLPRMAAMVVNEETDRPLSGAMLSIENVEKGKVLSKTTGKTGLVVGKQSRGEYRLWAQRAGFINSDTLTVDHQEDLADTIRISMRPVPKPIEPMLSGYVYDVESSQPLEALLAISSTTGEILYNGQASDEGEFVTDLKAGTYYVHLNAAGYMPKDDTISFVKDPITLTMTKIKEGKKVVLNNMFFATNKTKILPESEPTLEELSQFMLDNPTVTIRIIGHTDAVGSDEANQRLSEGRATAVRNELLMRGVEESRVEAEGRGESQPIADNDTEEGRQKNRRVEFEITGTGGEDIQQIKEVLDQITED